MTLRERLNGEMKAAMKARDAVRLSAIRMTISSIKNREIEQRRELDDQGVLETLTSLVKQRRESVRCFREAGRTDLLEKEEMELAVLLDFLPTQLEAVELEQLVRKSIAESGATTPADMGKVMKLLMPLVAGRAEGKVVGDLVRSLLA